MKLRVVGWASYDDDLPQGQVSWAVKNTVIDDVKKNGFLFSGWTHQEGYGCAPVLNDGNMYCFSQRGWGGVMAEAHGFFGMMDYAKFSFVMDESEEIRPKNYFDEASFEPEYDLNEVFELSVSQEIFDEGKTGAVKLDDLPELRYIDVGDTIIFICNGEKAQYTVTEVNRKKDLPEKKLFELSFAMLDYQDMKKMAQAERQLENAKVVLLLKLSRLVP